MCPKSVKCPDNQKCFSSLTDQIIFVGKTACRLERKLHWNHFSNVKLMCWAKYKLIQTGSPFHREFTPEFMALFLTKCRCDGFNECAISRPLTYLLADLLPDIFTFSLRECLLLFDKTKAGSISTCSKIHRNVSSCLAQVLLLPA